jgi:hypothetical protein
LFLPPKAAGLKWTELTLLLPLKSTGFKLTESPRFLPPKYTDLTVTDIFLVLLLKSTGLLLADFPWIDGKTESPLLWPTGLTDCFNLTSWLAKTGLVIFVMN